MPQCMPRCLPRKNSSESRDERICCGRRGEPVSQGGSPVRVVARQCCHCICRASLVYLSQLEHSRQLILLWRVHEASAAVSTSDRVFVRCLRPNIRHCTCQRFRYNAVDACGSACAYVRYCDFNCDDKNCELSAPMNLSDISSPRARFKKSDSPLSRRLTSMTVGLSGCCREKARSLLVSIAARSAPCIALLR